MESTTSTPWPAIYRGRKEVDLIVSIPGSKSVTNRALILTAQAQSPSTLRKPLQSRDTQLMVDGLKALGISITDDGYGNWVITPQSLKGPATIDVGNAGTVMRFLPPLAALAQGEVSFDGDARSYERPLAPVISALEELGIVIDHGGKYRLPMKMTGSGKISGGAITIDASKSSQFLSALLLIGPSMVNGISITHSGPALPSMPHIDMTVSMLRDFGAVVTVDTDAQCWSVAPGPLHGLDLTIEPDLSNAAPFLSLAIVCGGRVTISDWPRKTTQPGDQLREIFTRMSSTCELNDQGLTLVGGSSIKGIDIDLHDVGELTPSIAALAALADSPSHLRGIGHLRLHETDRLSALTTELNSIGSNVREDETSLFIDPTQGSLHGGLFHTYEDHRLATAGAVIGLVVRDMHVENIATTKKTLPDFPGLWMSLLS